MTSKTIAREAWVPDLGAAGKPVYLAVADAIADDLRSGRLAPGSRLPPQRELAAVLGVDLTTVTRAYAEARRRGLVSATVGRGTFVGLAPAGLAYGVPSGAPVDMTMNMPPPFQDEAVARAMWSGFDSLQRKQGLQLFLRYQDPGGSADDRAAGAAWLAERAPGLDPSRTLVSAGAQPALVAVLAALANRGDAICCEALAYPGLRAAAAHLGLAVIGLPMDEQGLVPSELARVCRDVGPKAVCCTPTLQNPTTATMSLARRDDLVRVARRFRLPIVEDDAYGRLPERPEPSLASLAPELTWHIAGLAKLASPAMRLAYVAAPAARAAGQVGANLRAVSGMASPILAALATRWIESGLMPRILGAIREETRIRRRIAAEALGAWASEPADAFHLWLRLPPPWTRAAFQSELQARDISVVPSDAFATTGQPPEAVRVGLGAAASRADLARALGAMAEVLGQRPSYGTYV